MIAKACIFARLSLLVCCLATLTAAQELTERQALQLLRESPLYRELQARVEVSRAESRRGTLCPNPSVTTTFEGAGRTDYYIFEQPLAVSGRRRLLRRAGESAVAAAEAEADHALHQIEAGLRGVFHQLAYARKRRGAIRASIDELQKLVRILREREKAGEGSRFDRLRAEREVVERETESADAEAAIAESRAALAGFLGESVDSEHLIARGTPVSDGALPDLNEALADGLAARSDYQVENERLEQLRLEGEAADRLRIPNPVISGGLKREQIGDRYAKGPVLGFSIDLPLFNKGRVEKRLAEAKAARTRARRRVLESRILAEVRAAHGSLRLRRKIAEDYESKSGRRAEELREIAEIAYQEDELGILELLDSYRVAQRAKLRLLELQAVAKQAEIEFDRTVAKELLP